MDVCLAKMGDGGGGVFIVSHGQFLDLTEDFPSKCTNGRLPRGQLTMNFGQTNLVKPVHSLPPYRNHSRQALVDLVPKWVQ
jgi:hypothetical protein